MLNRKWLFTVLLITPVAVYASDKASVEIWLQKMHHAAHTVNYVGKFVYQQDKQLSMMKIVHAVGEDGERERLLSLDEIGREVIRDKDHVTCILPDRKSVVVIMPAALTKSRLSGIWKQRATGATHCSA